MPVDKTRNVQRMWLGCVMGANLWFQSPLDVVQKGYVFRQLDLCCFVALFLSHCLDWKLYIYRRIIKPKPTP